MSNVTNPSDIPADSLKEKISSMVDGELDGHEYSQVITHVAEGSENGVASWEQYHLIGEAMRNNLPDILYADLSSSISAAIASEPAHAGEPASQTVNNSHAKVTNITPKITDSRSPVLGYAIAASISAIAIAGLYQLNQDSQLMQPMTHTVASNQQPAMQQPALENIAWSHEVKQEPVLVQNRYPLSRIPNEQLHRYIVNHNEHSIAMPAQGGMLPYARLVGYEGTQ